jgi:hypothetical protein
LSTRLCAPGNASLSPPDLQDPTGAYPQTTGLTETADRLYVQNLHLKVLGWRAR